MNTYRARALVTISVFADLGKCPDAEAARAIAESLMLPTLCIQCSDAGDFEDGEWTLSGELDGEPFDIEIDESRSRS